MYGKKKGFLTKKLLKRVMRFLGGGKTAKRIVTETVPRTSYQNTCQQAQQSDGQPGVLGSDPTKLFRYNTDSINRNGRPYVGQGI